MVDSEEQLKVHVEALIHLLENLGYIINSENLVIAPSKKLEFLSFILDSDMGVHQLPPEKIKSIRHNIQLFLKTGLTLRRGGGGSSMWP